MQQLWKRGHRAVDCWGEKREKEDDFNKIFVGDTSNGEVSKYDKEKASMIGWEIAELHRT